MHELPATRHSLLIRLHDPQDEQAWREFLEIYEPLVHRLARRRGFQSADADDLCQEVFRSAAGAIERWRTNPDRGSFRAWLFLIARNTMINAFKKKLRRPLAMGDTQFALLLESQPAAPDEGLALVESEYQWGVFHWAADQVRSEFRETTWRAFWRTSVDGEKAQQVAAELGISAGAVYIARSRVMARLKQKIEQVEGREL
jgi:RNA polymerase sigma-70 factor (ECF subfamily)